MSRASLAILFVAVLLTACGTQPIQRKDGSSSARSFDMKDLAKSDVDNVIEMHQQEILASLKALTLKLYRRNPNEWRRGGHASAEAATAALFEPLARWPQATQRDIPWQTFLTDVWRPGYPDDRIKGLMGGLLTMHMAAFNHQTEFYLLTELNAQSLYNAARNTEAVAWKLASARTAEGAPVLLSNSMTPGEAVNLSFEREFGKLIGIEDTLARIVEDKSKRAIRFGVVNLASMIFLPI